MSCKHEMSNYVGLNESFDYCKLCNLKESEITAAALKERDSGIGGRSCFNFIAPIAGELKKRTGYTEIKPYVYKDKNGDEVVSSSPFLGIEGHAFDGVFDEAFSKIAAVLKAELENTDEEFVETPSGLAAWLTPRTDKEMDQIEKNWKKTAVQYGYEWDDKTGGWKQVVKKPEGIDSEMALQVNGYYEFKTPWMGEPKIFVTGTPSGESSFFGVDRTDYNKCTDYAYEEEFNALGTVVSVDRHLGYVTIKLDDIEKHKDLEVNNRLYMDREEDEE